MKICGMYTKIQRIEKTVHPKSKYQHRRQHSTGPDRKLDGFVGLPGMQTSTNSQPEARGFYAGTRTWMTSPE